MKLNIIKMDIDNYSIITNYFGKYRMAKNLNISVGKLEDILRNCNAEFDISNDYHHFKTREDAEKAVKILESYMVMNKLTT